MLRNLKTALQWASAILALVRAGIRIWELFQKPAAA